MICQKHRPQKNVCHVPSPTGLILFTVVYWYHSNQYQTGGAPAHVRHAAAAAAAGGGGGGGGGGSGGAARAGAAVFLGGVG